MGEGEKGTLKKALDVIIIIIVGWVIFCAGCFAVFLFQVHKAQKWTEMHPEDMTHCAELIMMPEMKDRIERVYIHGIRDPEYCMETAVYASVNELYAILPFKNENDRTAAIEALAEAGDNVPEIPGIEGMIRYYTADILPFTVEDENGKVISYYYTHRDYVVQSGDGYRLVCLVQTN